MPVSNPPSEVRSTLLNYASRILLARPYFSQKLRDKLFEKSKKLGLIDPSSDIEEIIKDLRNSGYLDDNYLAQAYIRRQLSKGWGPKVVEIKLKHLGLTQDQIKEAISNTITPSLEKEAIDRYSSKLRTKDKRLVQAKLYQRGFRYKFDLWSEEG